MSLYFDARYLPERVNSYVAWVDVMGVRAIMSRSLHISATFVFKLHVAALEAPRSRLSLYPVMDGLYVVGTTKGDLCHFLESVFTQVGTTFAEEKQIHHRFIVKAAIAFGPVAHGQDLPREASWTLDDNSGHRSSILIGMPMVQAFQCESKAPPFGVYVHESARAFAAAGDKPFPHLWWQWFHNHRVLGGQVGSALQEYYDWCEKNFYSIEYNPERIPVHRQMAEQYFREVADDPGPGETPAPSSASRW